MKQLFQDVLEAFRDVNAANSPEEKAAAVETLVDTVKSVFVTAADKAQKAEKAKDLLKNKALDTMRQIDEKISELTGRRVAVVQEGMDAVAEVVNKEVNVPQDMDGEIRVNKTSVPSGLNAGAAVAYEFGLYYGTRDVPPTEWKRYTAFDVPMVITLKLPEEIDNSRPVRVYHFADGSSEGEEVYSELTEDRTAVTFIADGFSTYVILNETGETEDPGEDADAPGNDNAGDSNPGTSAPAGSGPVSPKTYDDSIDFAADNAGNARTVGLAAALAAILLFGIWCYIRKRKEN